MKLVEKSTVAKSSIRRGKRGVERRVTMSEGLAGGDRKRGALPILIGDVRTMREILSVALALELRKEDG